MSAAIRSPLMRREDLPWRFVLLAAVASGVFLRIWQLSSQMLIDDEWHAVRMALRADVRAIATHFGLADYSIPLTLYDRALYLTGHLNEWTMHLPLLLAGIALLLAPVLLRDVVSSPERAIWTALLAMSPSLIYFSRTARPYALLALLGVVAIVAFRKWWRGGDPRVWATTYVLATLVAGWSHILSLVFMLWPFAYYGIAALLDRRRNARADAATRSFAALSALGILTAAALSAALLPPLLNEWSALAGKAGKDSASLASVYRTALMQLGIHQAWLLAMLAALGALGIARLWRRDRDFVALTVGGALVGGIAICFARPAWIEHAPVLVRYAAPVLPFLLLYVAGGAAFLVDAIARRLGQVAATAITMVGVAALFVAGPLPAQLYSPNQFMDHAVFQFDYDARTNAYVTELELGAVPQFYRDLAARPPASVTIVEAPNRAQSNFMPDPWLQRIHRQNVKYALVGGLCGIGEWDELPADTPGLGFDRLLRLPDVVDGASGADFLVLRLRPWTLPAGAAFPWPVPWPDMAACIEKVAARIGAPLSRDDQIVVFALPGASASVSAKR